MLTVGVVGVIVIAITSLVIWLYDEMHRKPKRIRWRLQKQGIKGPEPSFLLGNIAEMRRSQAKASKPPPVPGGVSHEWAHSLFPFLNDWSRRFGIEEGMLSFMLGNLVVLFVKDHELVKEISHCSSLDLGKPLYLQKERGPLLGNGILTSNGSSWVYQRKIMSSQLSVDKIKGMYGIMIESANEVVSCWEKQIDGREAGNDIRIDLDMRNLSADVISKACFGSSYEQGKQIFLRLRDLQRIMSTKVMLLGLPAFRYIPLKSNREMWKLEKEIRSLILNVAKERKKAGGSMRDLLQMIIEGAENNSDLMSEEAKARFIVDNCKNVYFAGYETTAMSICWTLLLLASNPQWQTRVRDEIVQVCRGRALDLDMVNKMKLLRMVINEALRLYPTVVFISREALEDMQFSRLVVPKGVNIWVPLVSLLRDTSIWGHDADEFKPERFANGVAGACKVPQLYQPFGVGPRICAGQNFAIVELKIVLAILLTKFSFSVPPTYCHSPTFNLAIEPEHGINLLMKKI